MAKPVDVIAEQQQKTDGSVFIMSNRLNPLRLPQTHVGIGHRKATGKPLLQAGKEQVNIKVIMLPEAMQVFCEELLK
jgi:hypothetical protein